MSVLDPTVELLRDLVQRPSVTPDDKGCQALIAERLEALGFSIENMPAGDVENLWARLGTDSPLVVLAGHTDVVPTGDESQWRVPPFSAEVIDNKMYGRGTSDMKGGVAAMITAVERLLGQHKTLNGSIAFLITSDEEGPAIHGTRHVVDTLAARGETIQQCIVGEPSSSDVLGDVIRHGRRGSYGCRLVVSGIQGHVAYPHLAKNPVHDLSPFLTELIGIQWDEGNEFFPATSLQISNIHAGTGATNVIPGQVTVDFNLRYCPDTTPAMIQTRIEDLATKHQLDADFTWLDSANPFITEPGPLTRAVERAVIKRTGVTPSLNTAGGTSDGRFIAKLAEEVIEFGTTNATIHQIDECVDIEELVTASCIYEDVLIELLTDSPQS